MGAQFFSPTFSVLTLVIARWLPQVMSFVCGWKKRKRLDSAWPNLEQVPAPEIPRTRRECSTQVDLDLGFTPPHVYMHVCAHTHTHIHSPMCPE